MRNIHLAVLIHGLHGNPSNLAQCEIELVKAHQEKKTRAGQANNHEDLDLEVFIPSTFPGSMTFDGVELLAIRVAEELDAKIDRIWSQGGEVKAISIVSPSFIYSTFAEQSHLIQRSCYTQMGYSLGGCEFTKPATQPRTLAHLLPVICAVIARYLIALLDSRTPSFFEKHKPVHFSTIATPVSPAVH